MTKVKRMMYSSIVKTIAFLLALGFACSTVRCGFDLFNSMYWNDCDLDALFSEEDYYISSQANNRIMNAFTSINSVLWGEVSDPSEEMDKWLSNMYPEIEYSVKFGDAKFESYSISEGEFSLSEYGLIAKPNSVSWNCDFEWFSSDLGDWDADMNQVVMYDYTSQEARESFQHTQRRESLQEGDYIMLRIAPDTITEWKSIYSQSRSMAIMYVKEIAISMLISLLCALYLLIVAGRNSKNRELHMLAFDRAFVELPLLAVLGATLGAIVAVVVPLAELGAYNLEVAFYISVTCVVVLYAMAIACMQSLVRNLKNHSFLRHCAVWRICKWAIKWVKKLLLVLKRWLITLGKGLIALLNRIGNGLKYFASRIGADYSSRKVTGIFTATALIFGFLGFLVRHGFSESEASFVLLGIIGFFVLLIYVNRFILKRIEGFQKIVAGLKKLRQGELYDKIDDCPPGVMQQMGDDINSIGDGLQEALQQEMRAERMKTELITNVSHDLKTPLTSILNYSDLLCRETLTPDEANDYAKIIQQKATRLQHLTSDLFDISKVQSGNEEFIMETLDMCTLVRQALGEKDTETSNRGFDWKIDIPTDGLSICGDGKKLARVFENLLQNCEKYALDSTRIYVSVIKREGKAIAEIKNIANYEMNFDASEMTERFVRGDDARSTDGSGLGLAIAKSYVDACGGELTVIADGDLFKVTVSFLLLS